MYVIGTAGHVDHGKSTLVEALTGIDPDRLREEKERGMTIDLGFAWLQLPSGNETSIVDVPGHERFVNNMLAGVGGIDLALLVVAADESVMPQTREHLAILDLLRVERGLVAVTKRDLVDDDWLELVIADVEETLEGTVLERAEIYPVSAMNGEGLSELIGAIDSMLDDTPPKRDVGRPRLPIDRAFTISGFGTVVTGTLIDGKIETGQDVTLVVAGKSTRIRGLQTHKKGQTEAQPGTRVAANIINVSQDEVARGEVLTTEGWLRPTDAIDVRLRVITDAPHALRHNMYITVHTGSSEVVGRLRLLERDTLEPGESGWAQIKLESPLAVVKGDYYVIRSNRTTLGGGNIVETHARRHRRRDAQTIERLAMMELGSTQDVLLKTIETSEPSEFEELINRANMDADTVKSELEAMAGDNLIMPLGSASIGRGSVLFTAGGWNGVVEKSQQALEAYYRQFPLRRGAPKEELRSRLGMTAQVFNLAFTRLQQQEVVEEDGALARLPGYEPTLSHEQNEQVNAYIRTLESEPFSPPTDSPPDDEVLNLLDEQGRVVRVSEAVVYSAEAYERVVDIISEYIRENGEISVANVRDVLGTSRKYALALMDYMDHKRITRRVGDARVLR
ncbi:MAG: selenocysteine-specific translation elongation factor [Chloroflexi bacterium]|nr:selenocysteine-specific translation elongation factor [Chloroflexota bacterium]